ncbi:MAG: hypothetical protein Q7S78_02000 [Candidatus Azambacteria bacterium]|nr:hypothetical protein [Candidatus Azambacteria bacterium]
MKKQNKNNNIKFYFYFSCIVLLPSIANAQFTLPTNQLPNLNMKPTLSLTINTQAPLPSAFVSATANLSGITNVSNPSFSWFLNGVAQKGASGVNKNTFAFQVGNLGAVYKISLNASTPNGDNFSDSISVTVSDFDLTWDANSQAPALYKGKLLPTQKSVLNISALPFVYSPGTKTQLTNSNLIYNWYVDDKFSAGSSGAGKSNLILTVNDYAGASKNIRLEIKTSDGAVSISKSVEIPIVGPQVFIHLTDSKTGFPYGVALKNLTVGPISLNFTAQNYFFNATPDNLRWQWLIGDKEVDSGSEKPWLASLNLANIGPLFTQIQAIVKSSTNELETAGATINLEVK